MHYYSQEYIAYVPSVTVDGWQRGDHPHNGRLNI